MADPHDAALGIVAAGAALEASGLAPAASGNLSVRTADGTLLTPTGTRLGALDAAALARLDEAGARVAGPLPSKEAPLHLAIYRARPDARAIVHLHAPDAVAVSCLVDLDPDDALPAYTAYRVMRIGRLPLVGYLPPGDPALGDAAAAAAPRAGRGLLLANHGLVGVGQGTSTRPSRWPRRSRRRPASTCALPGWRCGSSPRPSEPRSSGGLAEDDPV